MTPELFDKEITWPVRILIAGGLSLIILAASQSRAPAGQATVIGSRPAGCPTKFCGCALSLKIFGQIKPTLNLAANWLRFPRTSPAPGMVAARRGHVFQLVRHVGGNKWVVFDPNSGGGKTRIHQRSIASFVVVNPYSQMARLN